MHAENIASNGIWKLQSGFSIELHPSTVVNVLDGVREQLNAHLLRYVDEFQGILLFYTNVHILTKKPIIHPYFPYFHLDVRADVVVFKPIPGLMLVGQVNHLGEDYISALVLGVFNVSIPARNVTTDLHFLREEAKWIHIKQPQHQIEEKSYVVFKVEEAVDNAGVFKITGSLRDPGTGAVDFLHPGLELPEPLSVDRAAKLRWPDSINLRGLGHGVPDVQCPLFQRQRLVAQGATQPAEQ